MLYLMYMKSAAMKSAARMFLGLSLLGVSAVNAAIVVTKTQKLEARITAQDEKSVTLTGETGNVLIVPRENILEIYDDKGELVWQEEGLKQRRLQPMAKQQPFFAPKSILLDLYISLKKNRIVIIITHRLSTVSHADRIFVLRDGRVEAAGKHAELLRKSRTYQRLWRAQ